MHEEAIAQAETLTQALPYIREFKGSVFVIKYGGSFMDDPDVSLRQRVATDIALLASVGIKVVIVHGGGKAISRAMQTAALPADFVGGYRVTTAESMAVVENTLNKEVNHEICRMLTEHQGSPIPIFGQEILHSRKLPYTDPEHPTADLGFVGEVVRVDTTRIHEALAAGQIPVISPIGHDEQGQLYNNNADVAAAAIAKAIQARRLVYLCDVEGIMQDPNKTETLISYLNVDEAQPLIDQGTIVSGMIPKVTSAVDALQQGVHRVHFVSGKLPHSLLLEIFTDDGIGTQIVHTQPQ